MAVHHSAAPQVERVAEHLIKTCQEFAHLRNVRMEYVFRSEAERSKGKLTLGKARKISGLNALLATPDIAHDPEATSEGSAFFVIEMAFDMWGMMNPRQREALTYHELLHCQIHVDDEGDVILSIRPHDVEAFGEEIAKYGPWKQDLYEFFETAGASDVLELWNEGTWSPQVIEGGQSELAAAASEADEPPFTMGDDPDDTAPPLGEIPTK